MGDVRSSIFALIGWLSVSACAAQVEPKCAELPVVRDSNAARAGRYAATKDSAGAAGRTAADRLVTALLGGIPRPTPGQFRTPEHVLGFLVERLASRDLAGALSSFPVVEHAERVTLKDRVEYAYHFSPNTYPLDDDRYGRLSDAVVQYLVQARMVALPIYGDGNDANPTSVPPGGRTVGPLHEFDGPPVALKIASIGDPSPDSPPQLNSIDRALGVTEKRAFKLVIAVDQRTVELGGFVGRVDGDWRILFASGI